MNQRNNEPSELEMKLASNAIDAVMGSLNLSLLPQELQEFKQQTIADAQAVTNEWKLESCPSKDIEES
jgi:hypothetical protein